MLGSYFRWGLSIMGVRNYKTLNSLRSNADITWDVSKIDGCAKHAYLGISLSLNNK